MVQLHLFIVQCKREENGTKGIPLTTHSCHCQEAESQTGIVESEIEIGVGIPVCTYVHIKYKHKVSSMTCIYNGVE